MAIIRVNKTADYTVMSNAHLKEKEMSLKAKGLLSLMLSLPDDWDYSIAGLAALSKDGNDSVKNTLNELMKFKYLKRTRLVDEKNQFAGYEYDIYEKPYTENPHTGNPCTEKPMQLNTNIPNTKKLNTKELNTINSSAAETPYHKILTRYTQDEETLDLLNEWLKVRKAKRAAMTARAVKLNLDRLDDYAKQSGMTVKQYLTEIIIRGWQAFYVINNFSNKTNNYLSTKKNLSKEDDLDLNQFGTVL